MKSLDTNVVLRFLLNDDKAQTATARMIFDEEVLLVSTVMLEVVWMLQRQPNWQRGQVAAALRLIMTLPRLRFQDNDAINWALDRFVAGADFADMMHLALSHQASSFVTFDRRIARYANSADDIVVPVETLAA